MSKASKLDILYHDMINRCYSPKRHNYKYYGARGITVCDEWLDSEKVPEEHNATKGYISFKEWALTHGYKEGLSIDRIDNEGNYCPENCRWITMKEQSVNKRTNRFMTYKGETLTVSQWAEKLGINVQTLFSRLYRGWSIENVINNQAT